MAAELTLRWICRILFIVVLVLMTYVSLLPKYDFSNWIPNHLFDFLGIPFGLTQHLNNSADKIAHLFGAFTLMLLIVYSKLNLPNAPLKEIPKKLYLIGLVAIAFLVEIIQLQIGRQFSILDILAGVLGGAIALSVQHRLPIKCASIN